MKWLNRWVQLCGFVCLGASVANGATLGFQQGDAAFTGTVDVTSGDVLAVDIVLSNLLPEGVGSFSFDVTYDAGEMTAVTFTPAALPSPLMAGLFGTADLSTPGVIQDINGGAFSGKTIVDGFVIGTLGFTVGSIVPDGMPDLDFAFGPGQKISDGTQDVALDLVAGADLASVPEPLSLALIAPSVLAIGFLRRRFRA